MIVTPDMSITLVSHQSLLHILCWNFLMQSSILVTINSLGIILPPAQACVFLLVCRGCKGCRKWRKEDSGCLPSTCPWTHLKALQSSYPRKDRAMSRSQSGTEESWESSVFAHFPLAYYMALPKGEGSLSQIEIKLCEQSQHFFWQRSLNNVIICLTETKECISDRRYKLL